MRIGPAFLAVGTGVIYKRSERHYIATAWHNFSGRSSDSLKPLSPTGALPDNVVATIGLSDPVHGSIRMPFTIPLETDERTTYLVHPVGWPRKDVAVLPIDPDQVLQSELTLSDGQQLVQKRSMRTPIDGGGVLNVQPIQSCAGVFARLDVPTEDLIDPGDELFVLGYPRGITDYSSAPIWKRATVATDPHGGWNRQPAFLIDCASREGMSGAPVIAFSKNGSVQVGGIRYAGKSETAAALHGIYVGRMVDKDVPKEDRFFEAQIGTVWKRSVIDEIIDAQVEALHSSKVGEPEKVIRSAVEASWPQTPDYFKKVLALEQFRSGMFHSAMERLNGNADPALVLEAIVAYAQNLESEHRGTCT